MNVRLARRGCIAFNQLALQITDAENAFMLLYHILCLAMPSGVQPSAYPMISPGHIARSLVSLKVDTRTMNLDKIVEEAHTCIKPFRLLLSPKR